MRERAVGGDNPVVEMSGHAFEENYLKIN